MQKINLDLAPKIDYMGENNQLFTSIFNVTKPHITHLIRGPGTVNVYDPERALKDLNLSKK